MVQDTSTDVATGVFALVRSKPAGNCIDVNPVADEHTLLAHDVKVAEWSMSWSSCKVRRRDPSGVRGRNCPQMNRIASISPFSHFDKLKTRAS
jgi:hypothetical protein